MADAQESNHNEYYLRDYRDKGTYITKRRNENLWMPALFLVALFFFVGLGIWNLANYRNTVSDPIRNGMQYGIGGAPGDIISPLPDPTVTPTPTPDVTKPISTIKLTINR